jgi:hypothetical protein
VLEVLEVLEVSCHPADPPSKRKVAPAVADSKGRGADARTGAALQTLTQAVPHGLAARTAARVTGLGHGSCHKTILDQYSS